MCLNRCIIDDNINPKTKVIMDEKQNIQDFKTYSSFNSELDAIIPLIKNKIENTKKTIEHTIKMVKVK